MDLTLVVAVGLVLLVLASRYLWDRRTGTRSRALRASAEKSGLALTADIVPVVSSRLNSRVRAATVGGMIGTAGIGAGLALSPGAADAPWLVLVLMCGMLLGAMIGETVADFRDAVVSVPEEEGPRLARSPVPTRFDYVGKFERLFTPVALLLAVLMVCASGLLYGLNPTGGFDRARAFASLGLPLTLLAVSIAAALAGRVAIARLLDHGQPATSFTALAWGDALRSLTVRSLSTTPGVIALYAVWLSAVVPLMPPPGDSRNVLNIDLSVWVGLFGLVLVLLLGAASFVLASKMCTQHYLRRLWPETAAELERIRPGRVPQTSQAVLEGRDDPDA